jgi:Cytochrome C oxidase, cbb3-type, subunit III
MSNANRKASIFRSLAVGGLLLASLGFAGCRQDMHDNPRLEANEDGANRQLPAGTVARGQLALTVPAPRVMRPLPGQVLQTTDTGPVPIGEDGFPFRVTREILDRGESRFNITCLPCHGKLGDGNGMIALRGFRKPPTYHQDRLRKAPTSHFYDVVTNGFGAMPSYTDQLTPEDRWKVIAYIRALQLSQNAVYAELADADKKNVDAGAAAAPAASSAPAAPAASGGHSN